MPSFIDDIRNEAKRAGKNLDHIADDTIETIVKNPGYLLSPELALLKNRGVFDPLQNAWDKARKGWGALGGGPKRTPKNPNKPDDDDAPHPGDYDILTAGGTTRCSMLPGGGQPFPLVGYVLLAAGAKTQGTDLLDFHAATANPTIITTADLIPGNVEVYEASLYLGVKMLTTAGSENAAFLNSLWLIERVNGIEKARWSLKQLGLTISHTGVLTSGSCASTVAIDLPAIPWRRKYDPNIPHALVIQCSVTTTIVQAIEFAFVETGKRP